MLLLITGILSSQSCKEKDVLIYDEYRYINNSENRITLKAYYFDVVNWNEFIDSIEVGSELIQKTEMINGSRTEAFGLADSIQVIFDDKKMATFIASVDTSEYNILSFKNYSIDEQSSERKIYTYVFSEEDYLNAK